MSYLLDHRPPVRKFQTSRNGPVIGGLIHCTAGLDIADEVRRAGGRWAGVDNSAERTLEWCATSTTQSSWHDGVDWDSWVRGLPLSHRAWHCRGGPSGSWRDYNDALWGLEISKTDMSWGNEAEQWIGPTLDNAARASAAAATEAGFPIRRVSVPEMDAAIRANDPSAGGFTGHRYLDPSRRDDPGADFPWDRFIDMTRSYASTPTPPGPPDPIIPIEEDIMLPFRYRDESEDIARFKARLVEIGRLPKGEERSNLFDNAVRNALAAVMPDSYDTSVVDGWCYGRVERIWLNARIDKRIKAAR